MNPAWILMELVTTLMTFWVSVPALSVQTTEAFAIVSQELRIRTRRFSAVRFVAKASARVTAGGRPSGTATLNCPGVGLT